MNRQKLILCILLGVFACSLVYSYWRMPGQTVAPPTSTARPAKAGKAPAKTDVAQEERKVRLDLLEGEQGRFTGFRRNIFKPLFTDEAKIPAPRDTIRGKRAGKLPPEPPGPPVVAPPPQPPPVSPVKRDMAKFTFLGFLKKDNAKTIFLSKDNEIHLVKKGDKIATKYEVSTITDDALTIKVLADNSEIVIPLVENKPLSMAGN